MHHPRVYAWYFGTDKRSRDEDGDSDSETRDGLQKDEGDEINQTIRFDSDVDPWTQYLAILNNPKRYKNVQPRAEQEIQPMVDTNEEQEMQPILDNDEILPDVNEEDNGENEIQPNVEEEEKEEKEEQREEEEEVKPPDNNKNKGMVLWDEDDDLEPTKIRDPNEAPDPPKGSTLAEYDISILDNQEEFERAARWFLKRLDFHFLDHQMDFLRFIFKSQNRHHAYVMSHNMGTGKTLTNIAAIIGLHLSGCRQKCIIVCPKSVVDVWESTFKKYVRFLRVGIFNNIQISLSLKNFDVIIVTYNVLAIHFQKGWLWRETKKRWDRITDTEIPFLFKEKYMLAIYDEAHTFRNANPKNLTHRSILELSKCSDMKICATGTIINNKPGDAAALLHAMNVDDPLAFKENWAMNDKTVLIQTFERFNKEFVHRVDESIIKDKLPNLIRHLLWIDTPGFKPKYIDKYNDLLEKAKSEPFGMLGKLYQVVVSPYLVFKLNENKFTQEQIMNHMVQNPTNKLIKLKALVESLVRTRRKPNGKHNKIVIVSHETNILRLCQAMCSGYSSLFFDGSMDSEERKGILHRFLHVEHDKILYLSLKAGGVGIHLVSDIGPTAMIFVNNWYSKAAHMQCEKRIHRLGQTKEIDIYYLMVRGTIDEAIYNLQIDKGVLANAVEDEEYEPSREFVIEWKDSDELLQNLHPLM